MGRELSYVLAWRIHSFCIGRVIWTITQDTPLRPSSTTFDHNSLPDYLQDFARFAYLTGWRFGEITTLEWRDIQEGTIRLRPEVSKNYEGRVLIVVGALAELVARRQEARIDLLPNVFHRQGQKIHRCYKAWRTACRLAGVPGKLFHDLRRTAVRNMIRAGVPERIAMSISGHKTRGIFDRYNIVNEDDIRQGLLATQAYIAQDESDVSRPFFRAKPDTRRTR